MAMPAMPGAGLVMVESEFIPGGLEAVLDRPAVAFDQDQSFDARSGRAPNGEERQVAIGDIAADQQPAGPEIAGPQARSVLIIFVRLEVGELELSPVVQPRAPGSLARRQPPPGGGIEALRNRICGARRLHRIIAHDVAKRIRIPPATAKHRLLPPRPRIARRLGPQSSSIVSIDAPLSHGLLAMETHGFRVSAKPQL